MTLDLSKVFKHEKIQKKTREMTIRELRGEVKKALTEKTDTVPLYVEIYKKINMSIASFVLILLGIPLGITTHRSEKSLGFGISLLLFAVYWGVSLGGIALALKGTVDPFWGVSLPNIVFFVLGGALFIRTTRR
jgi:lipopolysaccharide export system permease protein